MNCPECHTPIAAEEINTAIQLDSCYLLCKHCFTVLYWAERGLQELGDNELTYLEANDQKQYKKLTAAIVGIIRRNAKPTGAPRVR